MKKAPAISFIILLTMSLAISCSAEDYDFSQYKPDPRETDLYLVYHVKPSGKDRTTFQESVDYIADLLSGHKGVVPGASGYYFNRSKFSPDGVRITIFTRNQDSAQEVATWMTALSGSRKIRIVPYVSELNGQSVMTKHYEGDEKSFRRYLSLYTPVILECMQHDEKKTQAAFRSLIDSGGMDIELFEKSRYFMSLGYEERSAFIRSLFFNRKWMHMAINFALGYDED